MALSMNLGHLRGGCLDAALKPEDIRGAVAYAAELAQEDVWKASA
jgi:hypothetical protein